MGTLPISKVDITLEVLAKIANSMAKKYNCRVGFNTRTGKLDFSGDSAIKSQIAEETIKIFNNSH